MAINRLDGDVVVTGNLSANTMTLPSSSVTNASVAAGTGISASKLQSYIAKIYTQADGTDVASAIVPIHLVRGAGNGSFTLKAFDVICIDAPSGGDSTFNVDLLVGNTGDADGTTVLSSAVAYANGTSDGTVKEGTISDASHDHDDYFIVKVTTSGSSGTQGQGLLVELRGEETYPA